ncbi:MAG: LPS export ABC transporter periplasmic protein LptC [Bacteroidia bacterium]
MIRFLMYSILFLIAALLCSSCQNDIAVVNSLGNFRAEIPLRTTKDAMMIYSDSGLAKAKLNAPAMDQYEGLNPRLVMPKGIDLRFYNDSLRETTTLTADSAIKEDKDNVMKAFRHVFVVNKKGEKLRTEKLIWDEKKRIIYTDVDVTITTADGDVLWGKGLESNEDFSHWKIKNLIGSKSVDGDDK